MWSHGFAGQVGRGKGRWAGVEEARGQRRERGRRHSTRGGRAQQAKHWSRVCRAPLPAFQLTLGHHPACRGAGPDPAEAAVDRGIEDASGSKEQAGARATALGIQHELERLELIGPHRDRKPGRLGGGRPLPRFHQLDDLAKGAGLPLQESPPLPASAIERVVG